jgi:hydrogenase maturation protein HypF
VRGIVQGVGFRPFVYALAQRHGLSGLVRNDTRGVHIDVEGAPERLDLFLRDLEAEAPPLAVVEEVEWQQFPPRGGSGFHIEESGRGEQASRRTLIAPDVAVCDACLAELLDPPDRRYRYPFINCTNCGPRFTITRSIPYDRTMTTMAGFVMCPACRREYDDPADRRFHAQPNACPVCGPRLHLLDRSGREVPLSDGDAVSESARLLAVEGTILAVKGLGGYHLACDPFNAGAVDTLRRRKLRQDRPFALMVRNLDQVRELCHVRPEELDLLASPARPIVLLERTSSPRHIAAEVAPRQNTLGVMLAYTPLHHLLLRDAGIPLVMTSGNRTDEPIAFRDEDLFAQLGDIADFFLMHDRPIHVRCDDSVVRAWRGDPYLVRRSRGYAPAPLPLAEPVSCPVLACGGELKNTFCLARGRHAFMSHHIGDLENYETYRSFTEGIEHFRRLFDVEPRVVAYDLHPEYLSTRYARDLEETGSGSPLSDCGKPLSSCGSPLSDSGAARFVGVQHHHAHIASCLADNRLPATERVIGVAMDGTGYGLDGAIWGGEVFDGNVAAGFTRRAHLAYVPLPGGEAAIRDPWRMAISHLLTLYPEEELLQLPLGVVRSAGDRAIRTLAQMARSGLNSPPTSSAGRLFDAVAALLQLPGTTRTTYEGQAAVELELAAAGPTDRVYPFRLRDVDGTRVVETHGIVAAVVEDILAGCSVPDIASCFHRTVAEVVVATCRLLREDGCPPSVALSGGTFQNMLLLRQTVALLSAAGFTVHTHRRVPTNDGGIALGQVVLGAMSCEP